MYNRLYMALHIADSEVDQLMTELARIDNLSKTEALRRLLRRELDDRKLRERRRAFSGVATYIAESARQKDLPRVTKEEMDSLWGGDGS